MACMLAGCANDGSLSTGLNTGSVDPQKQLRAVEVTGSPVSDARFADRGAEHGRRLRQSLEGGGKKYKLKATDLTKADELNKANTEFQGKCSSYPPRVAAAAPAEPVPKDTAAAAKETPKVAAVAKAKPPVPSQKPVAAAMAPQETTQASSGPVAVGAPE